MAELTTPQAERITELREEVRDLEGLWEAYGAEWGDRLSEAASDLAQAEGAVGLRSPERIKQFID